jgi:flavin reductase (DIM6/NTAB) family NADH-FMN oxidoreductase RutF
LVAENDSTARVMHEMPYGLYIVGSREHDGGVNGMMADWVMQVSFQPRLIAVSFENDSHTLANVRKHGVFSVNLLAQDEASMELARRFAQPYSGEKVKGRKGAEATKTHKKLEDVEYNLSGSGCPILTASMAWLDCTVHDTVQIGDHTLIVGLVNDGRIEKEAEPMTSSFTGWTYSG